MEQIGTLQNVCRYPVKGMAGEEIEKAFVGFSGILGDRVYAFVRADGTPGFPWQTARELEDMLLFRPRFVDPEAVAVPMDWAQSLALAPGVNPIFPAAETFAVEVATPEGESLRIDDPTLKEDLEQRSGAGLRLRHSERSLYDCRPVSLFGNATAQTLSDELGMAIDRRRFRANFYVDWAQGGGFAENELVGRTLQLGDRVRIAVLERDPRCKVITLDPATGDASPRILRHLTSAHAGTAGVYAAVLVEGEVAVGDPICLL